MDPGPRTGRDLDADSPLLPFVDGRTRRAAFSVATGPPRDRPHVDGLLAGAAEVDLTPPPGMPKAGYSSNAHLGNGFRTRLRARVVHLRAGTTSLALVQCDLLGGSAVLQHLVAGAVADSTDVPLAGLWIGATHTHAGPGQFLGTDFYNRFASNRSGFDPAWTQFLVRQIAGGVQQAHDTRRPARLAVGTTEVWGLTRNRSLDPHTQNPSVTDRRLEPQRKFVAVNPDLHLLRVDTASPDGGHQPLAAAVVFSVHGTGISMKAREYNADVWAYLCGELVPPHRGRHRHPGGRRRHGGDPRRRGPRHPSRRTRAPRGGPDRAGHRSARRRPLPPPRGGPQRPADPGVRPARDRPRRLAPDRRHHPARSAGRRRRAGGRRPREPHAGHPPHRDRSGPGTPSGGRHPDQGGKWVLGSRWLQPLLLPRRSIPARAARPGPAHRRARRWSACPSR